ncbi:Type I secretion system ATP-binding protein PrsD [Beijerinckiaceae bacterium RH AL1]|nr:Type I secretion system ATP-binding protein PrsD [Beijerinckiaceae bacterium RH AL1]
MTAQTRAARIWAHPDFGPILAAMRPTLGVLMLTSCLINLLMLSSPLFMLQVYDRVLPSRSLPTLVALFALVALMIAFLATLEVLRARILTRLGLLVDEDLSPRVFAVLLRREQHAGARGDADQCVRDLDVLRGFASGSALTALFDLPWMGIYVAVCFLFHPMMGWAVLGGVIMLCLLAVLTEAMLRGPTERAFDAANARRRFADTMRDNAGLLRALGMVAVMGERFEAANAVTRREQAVSADIAAVFGTLLRSFRILLQSGLLALGAWLVIEREATAGIMLAATILTVRALAPVELLIANWKSLIGARHSLRRLGASLAEEPQARERTPLPAPMRHLRVTAMSLLAAGREAPVLFDVSFALEAGSAMGVIGPSGSGKSSLARALVGLWPPARGVIRLDGAELDQWESDVLGRAIGYLPQDVELLPGTIAENIARFRQADAGKLLQAADKAGVHEMILRMPDGYETQVGPGGALLSGGQRQRIALARALYDDPFLLVLDEPNSNLDTEGEAALTRAIADVRARGGMAVIIAHRPSALAAVDKVMIINEGRVQAFGARDVVLPQLATQPAPAPPARAEPARMEPAYVEAAE